MGNATELEFEGAREGLWLRTVFRVAFGRRTSPKVWLAEQKVDRKRA